MDYRSADSGYNLENIREKARVEAQSLNQKITTLHFLLVLCKGDGLASRILSHYGVTKGKINLWLKNHNEEPPSVINKVLLEANRLAELRLTPEIVDNMHVQREKDEKIFKANELHLLGGLVQVEESIAYHFLMVEKFNPKNIYSTVLGYLTGTGKRHELIESADSPCLKSSASNMKNTGNIKKFPATSENKYYEKEKNRNLQISMPFNEGTISKSRKEDSVRRFFPKLSQRPAVSPLVNQSHFSSGQMKWKLDERRFPLISGIGTNLNLKAQSGEIDPLLGREKEIECIMDVLGRRKANSPILVGEHGVGKTAIVEGLALKIVNGEVSERFGNVAIISIAPSALVGGTGIRGALGEKFVALKREAIMSPIKIVFFFDETLETIRSLENSGEGVIAEIKDALSQGTMPSIFTATPSSWKKIIDFDAGFSQCMTPVFVEETTRDETVKILESLSPKYAKWHGVEMHPGTSTMAVQMATRYLSGRKNPEKSIMVLDLAAARASRMVEKKVTKEVIAEVVSSLTDVPVERLVETDAERLLNLENRLSEHIVGHEDVIKKVSSCMRRNAAGFRGNRPIGSFLFLGPTGVGKTEMAKAMARAVFGKEEAIIRFDMSEFSEPHSVSRLIGAPPGYIGFERGGELTEAIIEHSYRLVLFDEFEKAHSAVHRLLLQILDDGRLTDSHGRTAIFSNCVVVLTSNIGSDIKIKAPVGFATTFDEAVADYKKKVFERAMETFSPELINRMDETVIFQPLDQNQVREVAMRLLTEAGKTIERNRNVKIKWENEVIDFLISNGGFDPKLGARPMRRAIQKYIESPVADTILSGKIKEGGVIRILVENEKIALRIKNKKGIRNYTDTVQTAKESENLRENIKIKGGII